MESNLASPWEDVADVWEQAPPTRDMEDMDTAVDRLTTYMRARVEAIHEANQDQPVLMLSGGIDSIAIGAAMINSGIGPRCITVATAESGLEDADVSRAFTNHFNLDHDVIILNTNDAVQLAHEAMTKIGTFELWEIAAAIPTLAVFNRLDELGLGQSPVITGGGADVYLAGGKKIDHSSPLGDQNELLRQMIWDELVKSLTKDRLVPDFYQELIGNRQDDLYEGFKTIAAWEATSDFGAKVLYKESENGEYFDKSCLRLTAERLGVPSELCWTKKNPMQASSGIFGLLCEIGRIRASRLPDASEYTDPLKEPLDQVVARFALDWIHQNSGKDLDL